MVALGAATISAGDGRTTIRQSTERAIIDWQGFDVGRDHTVTFDQPGRSSATLNRVAPTGRSVIQGAIEAPGTVIIQNNAGVIFTREARIDAGSLVATSQQVDAERFQRDGRLVIGGGEAADARVVNEGRITVGETGLAALVGGDVENAGAIVARQGSVLLASGRTTTIDLSGDGTLRFAVDGDAGTTVRGVRHSGTIDAADGRVVISAGAAARTLDAAINTTGAIRANSIAGDGGRIEIIGRGAGAVRIAGPVEATGSARGGDIAATGASVEIAPGARISAAGGGWRARAARRRLAGAGRPPPRGASDDGRRRAHRGRRGAGRGGEVVLWADGTTQVDGAISATGAAGGGRVETSGAFALGIGESADVALGTGGLWLLDPRDVILGGGANPASRREPQRPPAGAGAFTISATAIASTLNAGSDVTITTVQPAASHGRQHHGEQLPHVDRDGQPRASRGRLHHRERERPGDRDRRPEVRRRGRRLHRRRGRQPDRADDLRPARDLRRRNGPVPAAQRGLEQRAGLFRHRDGRRDRRHRDPRRGRNCQRALGPHRAARQRVRHHACSARNRPAGRQRGGQLRRSRDRRRRLHHHDRGPDQRPRRRGKRGAVIASGQAPLTLRAETQTWNGRVQAGDGTAGNLGGNVTVAGAVTAGVAPVFALAPDRSFTMEPAGPGGTASSYTSTVPLSVTTSGTGTIEIGGPVSASRVLLTSEERVGSRRGRGAVGLRHGGRAGRGGGAAVPQRRRAGAVSVTDPGARWLLYIDAFAGLSGSAPGPRASTSTAGPMPRTRRPRSRASAATASSTARRRC
jgi:filamentous hemagglutinin family protein